MKFRALKNRNVFIDDVRCGKATYMDLKKYAERWRDEIRGKVKLNEYLGITMEQYAKGIWHERKFKSELDRIVNRDSSFARRKH